MVATHAAPSLSSSGTVATNCAACSLSHPPPRPQDDTYNYPAATEEEALQDLEADISKLTKQRMDAARKSQRELDRFAKETGVTVLYELDTVSQTLDTADGFNVGTTADAQASKPTQLHYFAVVDTSPGMKESLGAVRGSLKLLNKSVHSGTSNGGTLTLCTFDGQANVEPTVTLLSGGPQMRGAGAGSCCCSTSKTRFIWSTYCHALWLLVDYAADVVFVVREVCGDEFQDA